MQRAGDLAAFVGGFVAAEGTFLSGRRFAFAVGLGALDVCSCELLATWFAVGTVHRYPRRRPHYDDEAIFAVKRLQQLVEVIVPFMDEHLPDSYKRRQYLEWRAKLLDYWDHHAKRRRPCTIADCGELQRAKELCRHHYFKRYRR